MKKNKIKRNESSPLSHWVPEEGGKH